VHGWLVHPVEMHAVDNDVLPAVLEVLLGTFKCHVFYCFVTPSNIGYQIVPYAPCWWYDVNLDKCVLFISLSLQFLSEVRWEKGSKNVVINHN
jgi:hypothetical protein